MTLPGLAALDRNPEVRGQKPVRHGTVAQRESSRRDKILTVSGTELVQPRRSGEDGITTVKQGAAVAALVLLFLTALLSSCAERQPSSRDARL